MKEDRYTTTFDHYFKDKIRYYELADQLAILSEKLSKIDEDTNEYIIARDELFVVRREQYDCLIHVEYEKKV